jgi:hypothetical protein
MRAPARIRLRAERKAGDLLQSMEKNRGGDPTPSNDTTGSPKTLTQLGISRDQSSRWQALADALEEMKASA